MAGQFVAHAPTDLPVIMLVAIVGAAICLMGPGDGEVMMAVDIDEEETELRQQQAADRSFRADRRRLMNDTGPARATQQDRSPTMPPVKRRFSLDDCPQLMPDGGSLHVPQALMRDAATRGGAAPLILNSGVRLDRFYFPDGSSKADDDPEPPRRRRKTLYRTAEGFEGGTYEEGDAALAAHRPGFHDANRSASEQAYRQMVADQANAWRPKDANLASFATSDATPPAGTDPREWAWAQNVRATADAWRSTDANGPEVAATTRAIPETLPAGAYAAVGTGPTEGDRITFNGRPAKLVRRGNFLYPEFIPTGATRAAPTNRGADSAMVGDRSAQDAAWRELQAETANAWRTP